MRNELLGKKIVSIFSSTEKRVFTVTAVAEWEIEARREKVTAYFGSSDVRLATDAEVKNDGRYKGSCPHNFVSYYSIIKKKHIPFEHQLYKTDFRKPSLMHTNAYICDWCGQHVDWDTKEILKQASHW
ncbi:MAG: hypothetical protein A2003_13160 [Acinetobacter sp. GWC1_38_13]|uniref:hypothetical protein n=1 Tax=Acinetobacter sp. GWC1_38_13 TaxID=1797234 RepID=UPI0008C239D9|nr:hypothetical protein [Acinetobacter sp. GWC1_38_13]OFW44104.1 MAG: hypothetical protein A2003_13160 [Acinetobacter sp. GWC1_38_13]HAV56895.1 hypothetical protein [Acinetobacter junii]